MLVEIRIKNFAIIDELALSFEPGLNAITGETGSGKSIIIEAINLLVGGRADTTRIKQGAESSEIEGLFVFDNGREFVLRRSIRRDGKNRAYINGKIAATGELAETGGALLDIHGQHEQQSLLNPKAHLELIDRFGGREIVEAKRAFQKTLEREKLGRQELEGLKTVEADRENRLEVLRWQIKEIDDAKLEPGEDAELERQVQRLKNHAKLFEAVGLGLAHLDGGASDSLFLCRDEIAKASEADKTLAETSSKLEATCAGLDEVKQFLHNYHESLAFDAGQLDQCQTRLYFLDDLKKKYALSIDGLIEHHETARVKQESLKSSHLRLSELTNEVAQLFDKAKREAEVLSAIRQKVAKRFGELILSHLREMDFSTCQFQVQIKNREFVADGLSHEGLEQIEFLFSANAGEDVRPLARIGSGGELARVMLAIRTVFGQSDGTPSLVFDEIDSGIGGKTAVKVGERLASLTASHQVICVTHLAQIAAFGDHHLVIGKRTVAGKTEIRVDKVLGDDRLKELSRLSGLINESRVSVEHARQLLDQASGKKVSGVPND